MDTDLGEATLPYSFLPPFYNWRSILKEEFAPLPGEQIFL